MSAFIRLPDDAGRLTEFKLPVASTFPATSAPSRSRIAYAAAHVVADPIRTADPWQSTVIDWDATMAFRRHLWGLGFKIAEAMDTAQRGMGFDWAGAKELIARSLAEAHSIPGADLASGAGTDHLAPTEAKTLNDVIAAYEEQVGFVEGLGGRVILMASRALAKLGRGPDDYLRVYDRILDQCRGPVVLHWLGDMFDPALAGYWGSNDFSEQLETVVWLIQRHKDKVEGIKISLLDADKEVALRDRLPEGVRMYTGDDFNYADLIAGDGRRHSHALLGIFDVIAPAAAAALAALDRGDRDTFHTILAPTVPLSRRIFEAPTRFYKSGVVFMAWLNGHQTHFTMIGGQQSARSILHYADIFRLAAGAGLIVDPDRAAARMNALLTLNGIS